MITPAEGWGRVKGFLTETRSEVKKVTFPSREEVIATTIVVLIASAIFAVFLWFSDIVILRVYKGIFEVFG